MVNKSQFKQFTYLRFKIDWLWLIEVVVRLLLLLHGVRTRWGGRYFGGLCDKVAHCRRCRVTTQRWDVTSGYSAAAAGKVGRRVAFRDNCANHGDRVHICSSAAAVTVLLLCPLFKPLGHIRLASQLVCKEESESEKIFKIIIEVV